MVMSSQKFANIKFANPNDLHKSIMLQRIQVEFNNLFLRSKYSILKIPIGMGQVDGRSPNFCVVVTL